MIIKGQYEAVEKLRSPYITFFLLRDKLTCAGSFPFDAVCLYHSASSHLVRPVRPIPRCYPYTAADYDSLVVESSTLASRAADWAWVAFAAAAAAAAAAAPCRAVDS
jgi:hypothetical protein